MRQTNEHVETANDEEAINTRQMFKREDFMDAVENFQLTSSSNCLSEEVTMVCAKIEYQWPVYYYAVVHNIALAGLIWYHTMRSCASPNIPNTGLLPKVRIESTL